MFNPLRVVYVYKIIFRRLKIYVYSRFALWAISRYDIKIGFPDALARSGLFPFCLSGKLFFTDKMVWDNLLNQIPAPFLKIRALNQGLLFFYIS